MLRQEKEEPIRIYGLYEPKRELGTTAKGRTAESCASYIAGLIIKVVKLSKEEKHSSRKIRGQTWRMHKSC